MQSRRITELEVTQALDNPETEYDSRHHADRLVVLGRTDSGRRLKIVITRSQPALVVTAADRDEED